jgi:uncharacterized membrane protein YgcG
VAALFLAGCGGGGGEDTTAAAPATTEEATPTLTKAELITQGDAICAEVNAAVGTVTASEAETSEQVSQAADLYGGMVERLQALGTPDEAAGYEEFAGAAEELAQATSDARLASQRGDEEALAAAREKVSSALSSFQEAARAYGFEDCAEAPSAPEATAPGGVGGEEAAPEEAAPEEEVEEAAPEEAAPEEVAPEEAAPETGGAGGTGGGTGTGGGEAGGGGSGGIGPG